MDLLRVGRLLLIPGVAVFGFRAMVAMAGGEPGDVPGLGVLTGVTGGLSALGMVGVLVGAWSTDFRNQAVLAFAFTGFGHYALAPASQDAGAAFVYLGLGLATPAGVLGGVAAAVGALMRADHVVMNGAVVGGLLMVLLALGWRRLQSHEP